MIRLFIEGREIELDNEVEFAITKQFEDLNNPTTIINDWSKTVSIPFTSTNNAIFGHIYNPDKLTVAGGSSLTGIYFDPLKKLDFRLEWGSAVLMTGYAKLNEVKQNKGRGSYEITLFGQLGKVFQEMKKITFDTSFGEPNYVIDGSKWVDNTYTKELVASTWESEGQQYSQLYPIKLVLPGGGTVNHPAYRFTDIIGFAPNNSFDEGFDYTLFEHDNEATKFADVLADHGFETATGIKPDEVIPRGLLPREIGEYRSYLQLPYIYWNKLFQMFQNKAESVTGYQFNLDPVWFDDNNPYWHDVVYMLKRGSFDSKSNDILSNYYQTNTKSIKSWHNKNSGDDAFTATTTVAMSFPKANADENISIIQPDGLHFVVPSGENESIVGRIEIPFCIEQTQIVRGGGKRWADSQQPLTADNGLDMRVQFKDSGNTVVKTIKILLKEAGLTGVDESAYDVVVPYEDIVRTNGDDPRNQANFRNRFNDFIVQHDFVLDSIAGKTIHVDLDVKWVKRGPISPENSGNVERGYLVLSIRQDAARYLKIDFSESTRSGTRFTMNDLWNNDVNVFDEILRYCKMFHIRVEANDFDKTLSFKSFEHEFENYNVIDWTNKVDKAKDFKITPTTLDTHTVVFNHSGIKTDISNKYKDSFGAEFGSYKLTTSYNFNADTKNLFSGCNESIVNTDTVLSWTNLYDNSRVMYSLPSELYVYNKDKDKKNVSLFGCMFFHKGLSYFSTEEAMALRSVQITDDSDYMKAHATYFYRQSDGRRVTTYPNLDIVKGQNMIVFNPPMQNYTYVSNYSNKRGIYQNIWRRYIDERYNVQNKKITCYVDMKPSDFINFKYSNFVKIGQQVCLVNKIYDYNITSSETTKVDLITVQDLEAYFKTDYEYAYIRTDVNGLTIPYDHYKTLVVETNAPWELIDNEYRDTLTVYPEYGPSGRTTVYVGSINQEFAHDLQFAVYDSVGELVADKTVTVSVGGTGAITISRWYNEIQPGGSITLTVTAPGIMWSVSAFDKRGATDTQVNVYPSISSGTQTITVSVPSDSDAGIVDVYLKDLNGNSAESFRVNIVEGE